MWLAKPNSTLEVNLYLMYQVKRGDEGNNRLFPANIELNDEKEEH